MKISLLFFVALFPLALAAQTSTPAWANTFSVVSAQSYVVALEVDEDGSNYSLCQVWDSNQVAVCEVYDILTKYDAAGQLMWQDTFCLGFDIRNYRMLLDPFGFLYIAGAWDTVAFSGEFMVTRVSPLGAVVWQNTYFCPSASLNTIYDVHADAGGNLYVAGESSGIIKAMMMKCDTAGNLIWVNSYDYLPNTYDRAWCITSDNTGNAYIGMTSQNPSFENEFVIAKYSVTGQFVWELRFAQFLYQGPSVIEVYNDTSIIATGWRLDTANNENVLTVKSDSAGNLIWWRDFDADTYYNLPWTRGDEPKDMLITPTGKIALTVEAHNNGMPQWINLMYDNAGNLLWVDKDSNLCAPTTIRQDDRGHIIAAGNESDMMSVSGIGVLKYDTLGNLLWHAVYDSAGGYRPRMDLDSAGNIYCAGVHWYGWPWPNHYFTTLKYEYTVDAGQEFFPASDFSVYPNPSSDVVLFAFESAAERTIYLTDVSGRVVKRVQVAGSVAYIDVSVFANGVYGCVVEEEGDVRSSRIVVMH